MKKNIDAKTYYDNMHRLGRWMTFFAAVVFFAVPLIVCLYFGVMPKASDFVMAVGGMLILFVPGSIAETIAETPIMGSSYYLACVTGNVVNMKLPAALNAIKIADVETGTEEADAVSGIAVAISSLVTMAMVALGVLFLQPLKPFLQSPVVATATGYILPALFGFLVLATLGKNIGGGAVVEGRLKTLIIPFAVALILYLFVIPDEYMSNLGFVIVAFIPLLWIITKFMYKKGMVTVELKESNREKAEEAQNEE